MKTTISTSILAGAFVLTSSLAAFAGGCNYGHNVTAKADAIPTEETIANIADESQVLDTGQISVATIDCSITPDAAECANTSATN